MLGEQAKVSEGHRYQQAVTTIIDLLKSQCQGFILPPSEVKNLLGLPGEDGSWHLHEHLVRLKKDLAKRFIAIEVNPIQGITVMLSRFPLQTYVLCSPRSLKQ